MHDRPPYPPGTKALQWGVTIIVVVVALLVIGRAAQCIGDGACTFIGDPFQTALLAFVGGPFLIVMVWAVPPIRRRRAKGDGADRRLAQGLLGAGAAATAIGLAFLDRANTVTITLLAFGPGLILGGLLVRIMGEPPEA